MGKPIIMVYKGQEMKFCCSDCPPKFKKNPEKYMEMLDEAEKKAAAKTESK
jgi:YHS domain-containing protein